MQLTMKERKFTIRDSFKVQDSDGNDKYQVVGEFIDTGVLHIKDMSGTEVARIEKKLFSLKPKFYFYVKDERVGEIIKDMSILGAKYHITGSVEWKFKGDILNHKYSILSDNKTVVSVKKKRLALTGTYVFDIEDESKELEALAAVLAMDWIANND